MDKQEQAVYSNRLKYLKDKTIPHLEGMTTIEELIDEMEITVDDRNEMCIDYDFDHIPCSLSNERRKQGRAILNFNTYKANHTPAGFECLPISDRYDCSREGCLAGWYAAMKESDNQSDETTVLLHSYRVTALRDHFGITRGETQLLFGVALQGAEGIPDDFPQEDTIWSASQLNVTKLALTARTHYLDDLIEKYEHITPKDREFPETLSVRPYTD